MQISPFSDILAAGAQDGKIYTFKIPEGGYQESIDQSAAYQTLEGHTSRVLEVAYHPTAENVMLSHCGSKNVKFWDLNTGDEKLTLPSKHTGLITSTSFSYDGALLSTFCKDKKLRVFDPRSDSLVSEVASHGNFFFFFLIILFLIIFFFFLFFYYINIISYFFINFFVTDGAKGGKTCFVKNYFTYFLFFFYFYYFIIFIFIFIYFFCCFIFIFLFRLENTTKF